MFRECYKGGEDPASHKSFRKLSREGPPGKDGKGHVGSVLRPGRPPHIWAWGKGHRRRKAASCHCRERESAGDQTPAPQLCSQSQEMRKEQGARGHSGGTQSCRELGPQKRDHP